MTSPSRKFDKVILGMDPGSKNFGISLVGLQKNKARVIKNSVLEHPVNDLVSFNQSSIGFLREIKSWMEDPRPDGIVAERFQTRGHGGPLIEMVSSMLGLIRAGFYKTPMKLTVASSWKNKFNRRFEAQYGNLKELYPECQAAPHQYDATLIAIFGLEAGLNIEIDYDPIDIMRQVEETSMIELRKPKKRRNLNG